MHIDVVIIMPLASVLNVKNCDGDTVDDGLVGGNKALDRSTNGDDGYVAGQYDWSR